jgi:glutamate formiminotransferase/formiminotetrahydrofolate cyclodeaminase
MLDAGRYFLRKQHRSTGVSEKELIRIAIKSMGLEELGPFRPEERIIEYRLRDTSAQKLISKSLTEFADETASESPAPGGGSIAAYTGALGISLATMVANLSAHKTGWDEKWEEFSNWADIGEKYKTELLHLVDADTAAFNAIMAAFGLPKSSEEEQAFRKQVIQEATKHAVEIPYRVMEVALDSMEVISAMADTGNPNSVTDAGVGALCAVAAIRGAYMNVRVNAASLEDKNFAQDILSKGKKIEDKAIALETKILKIVDGKLGN